MDLAVGEVELGLGQAVASLAQQQVVVTGQSPVDASLLHPGLAGQQIGTGGAGGAVGVVFLLLRHHVAAIEGVDALGFPLLLGRLGLQGAVLSLIGIEGRIELAILLLGLIKGESGLLDRELEGGRIQHEQQIPLFDVLVVHHCDLDHLAADLGRHLGDDPGGHGLGGEGHLDVGQQEVAEHQDEAGHGPLDPAFELLIRGHLILSLHAGHRSCRGRWRICGALSLQTASAPAG
ncbi:hypothetical protein D3C85_1048260 [compost metagenome]